MSQNQVMQERMAARHQRREERQRQREREERTSQQLLTEKNNGSHTSNGSNGTGIHKPVDPGASLNGSGSTLSSQPQQPATSKKSSSSRDLYSSSEESGSINMNHVVSPSLMDKAKLSLHGSTITSAQHHSNFLESHINSINGADASSAAHSTASVRRDSGSAAFALKPPSKDTRTYNVNSSKTNNNSSTASPLAPPSKDTRPYKVEKNPAPPASSKPPKTRKTATERKLMSSSTSATDSLRRGSLNSGSNSIYTDATPSARPSSTTRGGREPRRGNVQRHRSRSLTDFRVERTNSGNHGTRMDRKDSGNHGKRLEATPKTPRTTMKRGVTAAAKLGDDADHPKGKIAGTQRSHHKLAASYSTGMVTPGDDSLLVTPTQRQPKRWSTAALPTKGTPSSPEDTSTASKLSPVPPETPTRRKSQRNGRQPTNKSLTKSVSEGDPSPGAGTSSPRSAKRMSSGAKNFLSSSDRSQSLEESPAARRSSSSGRRRPSQQQPKPPRLETPQSARGHRSHRSSNPDGAGYKMPSTLLAKDDHDDLLESPKLDAAEAASKAFTLAKDALAKKEAAMRIKRASLDGSGSSNNSDNAATLGGRERGAEDGDDQSSSSGDADVLFTPQRTPKAAKATPNMFDSPDGAGDKSKVDGLRAPRSAESRRRRQTTSTEGDKNNSSIAVGNLPLTSQSMHEQGKQNKKSLSVLTAAVVEREKDAAAGWSMANSTLVNKWKSKLASSSASVSSSTTKSSVSVGTGVSSCNLSALDIAAGSRKSVTPPRRRRANSIGEVGRSASFEVSTDDGKNWFDGDSSGSESAPTFEDECDDDETGKGLALRSIEHDVAMESLKQGARHIGKNNKLRTTGVQNKDATPPRRISKGMNDSLKESNLGVLSGTRGGDESEKVRGRRMRDDSLQHSEPVSKGGNQKRGGSNPRSGSRARKPPGTRRSSGKGQLTRTRSRSLSDLQNATRKGRRREASKTRESSGSVVAEGKKNTIRKMHSSASRMDQKKKRGGAGKQLMGDSHSTFSTINTTKSDKSDEKERSSAMRTAADDSVVLNRRSISKTPKQITKPPSRRRGVPRTRSRSLSDLRVPRRDKTTKKPSKAGAETVQLSLKGSSTNPSVVSRQSSETVRKPALATRQSSVSKLNKTPDQTFDQSSNTLSTQESNNSTSNSNRTKSRRLTGPADESKGEEPAKSSKLRIRRSKTEELSRSEHTPDHHRKSNLSAESPARRKSRRSSVVAPVSDTKRAGLLRHQQSSSVRNIVTSIKGIQGKKPAGSETHTSKALRVLDDECDLMGWKAHLEKLEKDLAEVEHANHSFVAEDAKGGVKAQHPEGILNESLASLIASQEDIIGYYTKENERERAYQKALKERMFDLYQENTKLTSNVDQTEEYYLELEDIYSAEVMKNEALQKNIPVFQKVIEAHESKLLRRTRYIEFERQTTLYYRSRIRAIVRNFQEKCPDDELVETLEHMVLGITTAEQDESSNSSPSSSSSTESSEKD